MRDKAKAREYAKNYRKANKDKLKAWREANKEKIASNHQKYKLNNPDKIQNWKDSNKEKIACYRREYQKTEKYRKSRRDYINLKLKTDPQFKLNHTVRKAIAASLHGNKKHRPWRGLAPFTLKQLREHLEKQFTEGMSWKNYGKWHIDHIKPICSFTIVDSECIDFLNCWDLSNLRPLWAEDNIKKGQQDKKLKAAITTTPQKSREICGVFIYDVVI